MKRNIMNIALVAVLLLGITGLTSAKASAAQCPYYTSSKIVHIPQYTFDILVGVGYYACGGSISPTFRNTLQAVESGNGSGPTIAGYLRRNDQAVYEAYHFTLTASANQGGGVLEPYGNWGFYLERGGHYINVNYQANYSGCPVVGVWTIGAQK